MTALILKIEYDGTNFGGWQIQPNSNTVQENIEKAIFELTGYKVNLTAAGRTDAGVHARGMIASCELKSVLKIPEKKIPVALNSILPKDIRIIDAVIYTKKFNARFDAVAREYSYSIHMKETPFLRHFSTLIRYNLDFDILQQSAKIFLNDHNFTSFSKINNDTKSYVCRVYESFWEQTDDDIWVFHIKADRFVYGMVRSLIGAMIDAARGKRTIDDLTSALERKDRTLISPIAPPNGLVLERIYYPKELDFFQ